MSQTGRQAREVVGVGETPRNKLDESMAVPLEPHPEKTHHCLSAAPEHTTIRGTRFSNSLFTTEHFTNTTECLFSVPFLGTQRRIDFSL